MGRYSEAEREYREVIRIDPYDPEPHVTLGQLFSLLGRHREACEEFRIAKRIYKKCGIHKGVKLITEIMTYLGYD
ncbi:MAG: bacterial transcriptional activator domain-containing protein [candidate division WOR-3 bacterium]